MKGKNYGKNILYKFTIPIRYIKPVLKSKLTPYRRRHHATAMRYKLCILLIISITQRNGLGTNKLH